MLPHRIIGFCRVAVTTRGPVMHKQASKLANRDSGSRVRVCRPVASKNACPRRIEVLQVRDEKKRGSTVVCLSLCLQYE